MNNEIDNDIYCSCIVVVLLYLLDAGEERAKLEASEIANAYDVKALEGEFFDSAKSIAEKLSKTEHTNQEIIRYLSLYTKFLKRYNSNFSPKSFLGRTFRGKAFSSKEVNSSDQAISRIIAFLLRCLTGTGEPDWFQ